MSEHLPSDPTMTRGCAGTIRRRGLPDGSGFAIAAAFGALGLAAALVLWAAGAPLWLALAVYLTLPGLLLVALFLATRPLPLPARPRALREENRHV